MSRSARRIVFLMLAYTAALWFAQGCCHCSKPEPVLAPPHAQGPANPPDYPFVKPPDYPFVKPPGIWTKATLLKLHLVRPDLIPYPLDTRYYA